MDSLEALQFTSNVIELKSDKKYLLIFKDATTDQLNSVNEYLWAHGFHCACIRSLDGEDVQVIEAPAKSDPSEFWRNLSRDMTINERRAIFAKLAEYLGVPVSELGESEQDGEKHRYSLDTANKILEPYKKIEDYLT
jgi:hypothetical protein